MKDQFWKEKVAELQDVEVRNLTFAVPMQSRHFREVVRAVQEVYMRLRTLQLPVLRLHSDRAREFTGKTAGLGNTRRHPTDQYSWRRISR